MLKEIKIESILGGQSPTKYFTRKNQFDTSIAIDPDFPADGGDSQVKAGGAITPIGYAKFSGANVDSLPVKFITTDKDAYLYALLLSGALVRYTYSEATSPGTFGSEAEVATFAGSRSGFYYNNYIYNLDSADVDRYGPLNNSPSATNDWWTSTLSLTAPTSTDYGSVGNYAQYPRHVGHVHVDGAAYFTDYANGLGMIHKIKTTKTTDEGDTDDGSAYNVLDLPYNFFPTDIKSWGNDLAILAHKVGSSSGATSSDAALFLWDTFSDTFYKQIPIKSPIATALQNRNGNLIIFHGYKDGGVIVSQYLGGDTLGQIAFLEDGFPPNANNTAILGNRITFATDISNPEAASVVYAIGYKQQGIDDNALHCIARSSSTATNSINAIGVVQNLNALSLPRLVLGWRGDSTYGIDNFSPTATLDSIIKMSVNVGEKFQIKKIRLPLSGAIAANQTIIPKILLDNETTSKTLPTINSTNYTQSEKTIVINKPDVPQGNHDFTLELDISGTDVNSFLLPITIIIETLDD